MNQISISFLLEKPYLRYALFIPALIILGASLAFYADSPLLIIPLLGILALTSFSALDIALYIFVASLTFSFRFIMASGTEMQIPTEPLLAIMAGAFILRWIILAGKGVKLKFPFKLPMLLYATGICLSLINTTHLYASIKGSFRALMYMMLSVVVFYVISDRQRLKRFFIISIIPATIAVGWTAIFLVDRIKMWRWTTAYEGTPFTSYAHYGSFVAVLFLIFVARAIYDKGSYDRIMWLGLTVFYGIAICLCFSRGVWLAFIIAIAFLLIQRSDGIRSKKMLIMGAGVIFFVILLSIPQISHTIMDRASTIINLNYGTNRERLLRWGTAIAMFERNPILGAGYGSFAFSYINDPAILGSKSKYGMGAHSEYLQVLSETGLVGFIGWMWIIISFFLYGFRLLNKLNSEKSENDSKTGRMLWRSLSIGVMSAELALLIHFLVNNLVQSYIVGVPFWVLMGILPAIGNIAEKELSKSNQ
jgi:putative inorganic carbon (HCO3(-)) transporter